MQHLDWESIYYYEELDTDDSVLYWESTEEAPYRGGYLIKNTRDDLKGNVSVSICFIDNPEGRRLRALQDAVMKSGGY